MHDCCEDEEDDEDNNEIELAPKINTYKEVNEYLEEVQHFLESQGHALEAFKIGSIMDDVSCIQNNATRQTAFRLLACQQPVIMYNPVHSFFCNLLGFI